MDFGQAISACFKKYVDFKGRAQRAEFWWFALFIFIVNIVARATVGDSGAIGGLIILGMFIPFLAVAARRYHDTGRTGWWALTFLLPLVGMILALFWLTKRGTVGPNQYGEDPLGGYPGEQTYYKEYDARDEARSDDEMFRGNTQREPRDRDEYKSEPRAEYRNTSRDEKAPHDKSAEDKSAEDKSAENKAAEGPWADRKPKNDPEPTKQIKEVKKRKIEPPRFGRDARKKDD